MRSAKPNRDEKPIFTAAEALEQRRRQGQGPRGPAPQAAILYFGQALPRAAAHRHPRQPTGGFLAEVGLLKKTGRRVALAANFGVGAPAAVALLEELAAFGARDFIAIGTAGGLQTDLQPGDMIVCNQALRDEGVSAHYQPAAPFAFASTALTQRLQAALELAALPYRAGASWTTDAPYRELAEDVMAYSQTGLLTVEMEAAALFAAGQALGLGMAAAFVIADALALSSDSPRWRLTFDPQAVQAGLGRLLDAAVIALQTPSQ